MALPSDLPTWLSSLPADVDELRLSVGTSSENVASVAAIPREGGDLAGRIRREVEGAGLGACFRVFAHAGRKVVTTRYFAPADAGKRGDELPDELPKSTEQALYLMVRQVLSQNNRQLSAIESLVTGIASPVEALAGLFRNEAERRKSAEDRMMELMMGNLELTQIAQEFAGLAEIEGDPDKSDALRDGAARLVDALIERFSGADIGKGGGGRRKGKGAGKATGGEDGPAPVD